jgi:hypothetical protein
MLLRRLGKHIQEVEPHFDPRALTEIGFRPSGGYSEEVGAFDARMEAATEHRLEAKANAPVQADAEQALLDQLRKRLDAVLAGLAEGEVAVIESQPGLDWPRTRERRKDVIVDGENRFHFHWRVEPPLRVVVHRPREGQL